jgi:hypothetical protein
MGNKINMIATRKINESMGFEVIGSNPTENTIEEQLKNEEYTGHFLPSDPDEREYFMKCPQCRGLIPDNGLNEKVECDICKKIILIPENVFQDVKQASLYDEPKKKKVYCKNLKNFCRKLSSFLPLFNFSPVFTLPSFKHVTFYINKEKLENSAYQGKDFIEIMNNIIIPFFQYKSRILNIDKIFEIDGVEFKVMTVYPHYLTAKVSSSTSIVCNNYYSFTTPITNATFLTIRKRELESNEYISNQIINTPYPTQKSIIEGHNCRINTYDLVVRNCSPSFGVITDETNVRVINRNIETLKSVTIAILVNEENHEFNNKKNNKIIFNNFIRPYFFNGNKKYIERGDIIDIGKLKIFILKSKPSTGFVVEDLTKISLKFNYTLEQSQNELNEQIENESLENRQSDFFPNLEQNNTNNVIINTSTNSENNFVLFNEFQERMRVLNALLAHRRRLLRLNSQLNNINGNNLDDDNFVQFNFNFFNRDNEENNNNIINEDLYINLPVFKIDEKFMENSKKHESKNEQFEKCVICMEKYEINDEVKTLPCFHIFHKDCIDHWFKAGNDSCPICKNKINNNKDLIEDLNEE